MTKQEVLNLLVKGQIPCSACHDFFPIEEIEEERCLCKKCAKEIPF